MADDAQLAPSDLRGNAPVALGAGSTAAAQRPGRGIIYLAIYLD
jgi:hypothetical protein